VLTVSVGPGVDVAATKAELGSTVGTARALVCAGDIKYATPDQAVPETIRKNIAYLVQEMYRAAHVRFRGDSLDAESGAAIRLQYSELNEMLQGLGTALAQCERQIARVYFAWQAPTPEAAQALFEAAQVEATYPDEFFLDDLAADLEAWAQGLALDLGLTMTHRIKKRAVRRIDPDIPEAEMTKIEAEIDAMTETPMPLPAPVPLDLGHPQQDAIGAAKRVQ
jgi:hypothetical protein